MKEEEFDVLLVGPYDAGVVLEPKPIVLKIPSSKEFDDEPDDDDIF
jgi:hypothetical protein